MWKHFPESQMEFAAFFVCWGSGKGLGPAHYELFIWIKMWEGIYKDSTNEHVYRTAMETQTLKANLWTLLGSGGEGEGGRYGESNMETWVTICNTDSQWEHAVWLREPKPGLGNNPEEWDGEGGGRDFQVGGDMDKPMADSCWCLIDGF